MQIDSGKITLTPPQKPLDPLLEELVEGISELLNQQIRSHGRIGLSNPVIWNTLHKMDDNIWDQYLAGLTHYSKTRAEYAKLSNIIKRVQDHLQTHRGTYAPWTLTAHEGMVRAQGRPKEHSAKGAVWSLIMSARECYCAEKGIHLPNADSSKGDLT